MVTLYVLFDASCELCVRCAKWLGTQRSFVPLRVASSKGAFARGTFPELMLGAKPEEFVLIDDAGNVYRDTEAWLLLLWSLREYRAWSLRLATPCFGRSHERSFTPSPRVEAGSPRSCQRAMRA